MVVEHDVVKNQEIGDCVVIEKSPSRVSAVRIFKTSDLVGAI
jgi:uncharacterized protein YuzE